jgi:hypothetical protein
VGWSSPSKADELEKRLFCVGLREGPHIGGHLVLSAFRTSLAGIWRPCAILALTLACDTTLTVFYCALDTPHVDDVGSVNACRKVTAPLGVIWNAVPRLEVPPEAVVP